MSTRIVHFSDWHGSWFPLPEADIYICTGNMFPDFSCAETGELVKRVTTYKQVRYARKFKGRKLLANPEATVIVCRGDFDFTSLARLFSGGKVLEIGLPTTVFQQVEGLKIGGFRGIKAGSGVLSDEFPAKVLNKQAKELPKDLNILVTHSPPYGINDQPAKNSTRVGLEGLADHAIKQLHTADKQLKLHCFGNSLGRFGVKTEGEFSHRKIFFSNAAGGWTKFELVKGKLDFKDGKKLAIFED
jgi:Icc-related predicted phosphoesterase